MIKRPEHGVGLADKVDQAAGSRHRLHLGEMRSTADPSRPDTSQFRDLSHDVYEALRILLRVDSADA